METVDASLCGCGALGNSSQCVSEMLSEGNSGGGGGVLVVFAAVSRWVSGKGGARLSRKV